MNGAEPIHVRASSISHPLFYSV